MVKVEMPNQPILARTRTISIFLFLQRVKEKLGKLGRLGITALSLRFIVPNLCPTCSEVGQ